MKIGKILNITAITALSLSFIELFAKLGVVLKGTDSPEKNAKNTPAVSSLSVPEFQAPAVATVGEMAPTKSVVQSEKEKCVAFIGCNGIYY